MSLFPDHLVSIKPCGECANISRFFVSFFMYCYSFI